MIITYILFLLFFIALIISIIFSFVIYYHFQRFKIFEDSNPAVILKVFATGNIIILSFSLLFLLLFFYD